jgi:(5-formylfuran-3-yl)methyl phosphate synthase
VTFMLASVVDAQEAEIAVRHGADIVDVKDVRTAFGSVGPALVRKIAEAVAEQRPVSAVIGERAMKPEELLSRAVEIAEAGAIYIKVGLHPQPTRRDCIEALSSLASRSRLVGVMFADHGVDESLIELMAENRFSGVMIDTFKKNDGRLFDHLDIAAIGRFVDTVRSRGLMAGLAGSLEAPDIPRLLLTAPDVLGFRRALCTNEDRTSRIDPAAVDIVRGLIPIEPRGIGVGIASPAKVDYRLLAARGYSLDAQKDDAETDTIFVREFILPVRIGAYAHERGHPQRVRFDVDAQILRAEHVPEDMRDVVSYDLITDSIRMVTAQEHISLIETLAERVAALILTHRRVTSVTVRAEKLEAGPGSVGVKIVRHQSKEKTKVHQLFPAAVSADPKAAT